MLGDDAAKPIGQPSGAALETASSDFANGWIRTDEINHRKVAILLAEYNGLRAEVIAARGNVAQAFGIAVAAFMVAVGFVISANAHAADWRSWIMPSIISIVMAVYFVHTAYWNDRNTKKFTDRLRELESEINFLASDRLLVWETFHGWGRIFCKPANPDFIGKTPPKTSPPARPEYYPRLE